LFKCNVEDSGIKIDTGNDYMVLYHTINYFVEDTFYKVKLTRKYQSEDFLVFRSYEKNLKNGNFDRSQKKYAIKKIEAAKARLGWNNTPMDLKVFDLKIEKYFGSEAITLLEKEIELEKIPDSYKKFNFELKGDTLSSKDNVTEEELKVISLKNLKKVARISNFYSF
tara:strand:+ start:364 stop:864 length:501 start_codon:yes stop_codon:yes gene_type:complete